MNCPTCHATLEAGGCFCVICGQQLDLGGVAPCSMADLLEGKSLRQMSRDDGPIGWRRGFEILGAMCNSLAQAHARGICHRDLKPENIYLEERPGAPVFVKFLDASIAVMRGAGPDDTQASPHTARWVTIETQPYASPEQLMGTPRDGRSDIYVLGTIAYELITGQVPFPDAQGPAGLITAQLKQRPLVPSVRRPPAGIPGEVDAVLLKCLEKDKTNRYPDVTALAKVVLDVLQASSQDAPRA